MARDDDAPKYTVGTVGRTTLFLAHPQRVEPEPLKPGDTMKITRKGGLVVQGPDGEPLGEVPASGSATFVVVETRARAEDPPALAWTLKEIAWR